uniref:CSON003579 protein n=1 Tax=Culicoides sonorensis TaxID=179676 RepID=A0A336LWG3_CULSO
MKIVLILCYITSVICISELGCRDENNVIVDWYYLYKLPKDSKHHGGKVKSDGLDYVFITSNTIDDSWVESKYKIDDPNSITGKTIKQLYDNTNNVALMYNDEPPSSEVDMVKGHTKGVMASDDKTGFWLIHSVPHFPPELENGTYNYPLTGHTYGQSFLCITMNSVELNKAGEQLLYNEPHIYSSRAPSEFRSVLPNLFRAINGDIVKMAPFWNTKDFHSIQNTMFRSFAKTRHFGKDLYEDWVAPALQSDLNVETWQHGTGNMASNYSKWAVSTEHSKQGDWICVGDINRQEHQKKRGGGTVCQNHKRIATFYQNSVQDVQPCSKKYYK